MTLKKLILLLAFVERAFLLTSHPHKGGYRKEKFFSVEVVICERVREERLFNPKASFSLSDEGGSSGNKVDSEGEEIFDEDMKEMSGIMKTFNPYLYEPERDVSTCSDESHMSDFDKTKSEKWSEDNVRVRNLDWCKCGNCSVGKKETDCFCCFEVHALKNKFDYENVSCIIQSNKGVRNVMHE